MLSSIRQHVATLQFDSCAEKHSLCGTVMIHDGLNLTCLDQGHGVRSHGKSSRCSNEGEGQVCCVQCAKMWQDCSLTAVQRNAAFVEQS